MPRRRRGRQRGERKVGFIPKRKRFSPSEDETQNVILKVEEVETLRLVDLNNMTQEEAAREMGVSRKTLWSDLKSARKKVAKALTEGLVIKIEGGKYYYK